MSGIPHHYKPLPPFQTAQNHFLSYLANQNIPVFIFLKNGMIYKQAISTISGDCLSSKYIANNKIIEKELIYQ